MVCSLYLLDAIITKVICTLKHLMLLHKPMLMFSYISISTLEKLEFSSSPIWSCMTNL